MTRHTVNDLIQAGVALLNAGRKAEAQELLKQAISQQPTNEQAWLWISGTVEAPAEQRAILRHVLVLNPANLAAQRGLSVLDVTLLDSSLPAHGASLTPLLPVHQAPPEQPVAETQPVEPPAPWSPPEPLSVASLAEMPATCPGCEALVYGNAEFCWRCHAAIHCCATCTFVEESMCKELQQIATLHARNRCPWWRPPL